MSEQILYKILENGLSCHGGDLRWSLPTQRPDGTWEPGAWHEVDGPLEICRRGLHLTTEIGAWLTWDSTIYEAEARGIADWDTDRTKCVCRAARLLRRVPPPSWWETAQRFVREEIPAVRWFRPDGAPDPAWKLFTAPSWAAAGAAARAAARYAAGDAVWGAAWAAARDAAWSAARDAAWAAARSAARDAAWAAAWDAAWDAAGDAVWGAAWAAARDAAWSAARDAAWAAARDAALVAQMCVVSDLPVAQRHRDHVAARWEVWRKGYALLCDVDGVLYVYAAREAADA